MFVYFTTFIFLLGLIIGSFINCLVWRLYKKEGVLNRSYCPKCRHQIAWYDNIPVLSFIILCGKCRHCHKAISLQYPAVELIVGFLFVLAWYINIGVITASYELWVMSYVKLFRDWFIISVMVVIFIYDLRWYLILDKVTIPAMIVVFIFNLALGFNLWNLLISGIIGGSFFLVQFLVSRGKWVGGGDIRLGALMGLILGWPSVILAIFLAYIIGSIAAIGLLITGKKKWGSMVPMGIFLSTATVIILFWGDFILNWYLGLLIF